MSAITRVLISVSDKRGIVDFARELSQRGVEILSTGGTARTLTENDIPVTEVSDYTGFPEMMDGRVKTLHPKIHAGILGRRGTDDQVMRENGIHPIDMIVANILMALGMQMMSPTTVSLPFKLLLFVMIDGWYLITKGLITGYI